MFPKILLLVKRIEDVLFLDEAVYTNRLHDDKVWAAPGSNQPTHCVENLGGFCIAILAALNCDGYSSITF